MKEAWKIFSIFWLYSMVDGNLYCFSYSRSCCLQMFSIAA